MSVTPPDARNGWVDRPTDVAAIINQLDQPVFAHAAGPETMATEHRDIFAWEQGEEPFLGHRLPAHEQTIGDCVSHGTTRACQDIVFTQLAKIGARAEDEPILGLELATEPTYALSRVEIGGGRIRGDGSVGAWGADAVVKFGLLQRTKYGEFDLSQYSGSKARSWGAPGRGLPDELEPIAMQRPIKTTSFVQTDDEAKAALYNMYYLAVCSNRGFKTRRDQYGFCDPSGSWAHCMEVRGICLAKRSGQFVLAVVIQQSWGNSPTGPDEVELKNGRKVKMPQGCFLCEMDVFYRDMLRARDTFAFSHAQGFVPQRPHFQI